MLRRANHDFFKQWSADMAYVLGYFAADGSMIKNNRGAHFIEFNSTDKYLISVVRKLLDSNHKISTRISHKKEWKNIYRLQIGSKVLFDDITKFGFHQNKSLTMRFPDIPPSFVGDFIRGYFDGDGGVYFRKYAPKDRPNPRWVFQARFTSGSKEFLLQLHIALKERGIVGGYMNKKKRGYDLVLSHRDSVALSGLMYHNALDHAYLKRKFNVFVRAINTLYGGVAQIG